MILSLNKEVQRKYFRVLRKNISIEQRIVSSVKITQLAFKHNIFKSIKNIGIFLSFDGEINTYPLIIELWKKNYNVYLPTISCIHKKKLKFVKYSINTILHFNKYNILEPFFNSKFYISSQYLDVIFVPLVSFDSLGNRLGMGGGFYDKLLQNWKKKFFPIGLAFDCQLENKIYMESWDVSLPAILTPNNFWQWKY